MTTSSPTRRRWTSTAPTAARRPTGTSARTRSSRRPPACGTWTPPGAATAAAGNRPSPPSSRQSRRPRRARRSGSGRGTYSLTSDDRGRPNQSPFTAGLPATNERKRNATGRIPELFCQCGVPAKPVVRRWNVVIDGLTFHLRGRLDGAGSTAMPLTHGRRAAFLIQNCRFEGNQGTRRRRNLRIEWANGAIVNCVFHGQQCSRQRRAPSTRSFLAPIVNCVFRCNVAGMAALQRRRRDLCNISVLVRQSELHLFRQPNRKSAANCGGAIHSLGPDYDRQQHNLLGTRTASENSKLYSNSRCRVSSQFCNHRSAELAP